MSGRGARQEILHRCAALERRDAIEPAFAALLGIADELLPLDLEDVESAKTLVLSTQLSARDALHLAVMRRHGARRILTFDRDFDGLSDVRRLH